MKTHTVAGLFLSCLLLASFPSGMAQTNTLDSIQITPALQWKYGWQDGSRANTTGNARGRNVLPLASGVPSTGYLPSQISKAYGFDQITGTNGNGTGQKIAVVVAYGSPSLQSDLNRFNAQYGLPTNAVPVYYPNGVPTNTDSGWAGETTLDVEWSHAMAPGASIVVVVAPNASGSSLLSAINYATGTLKANVVSMSWGGAEFAGLTAYDSYFNKPGVSFVASSGDSGAGVSWPAVSTNVVAVGGTSLLYNTVAGTISSEVAWSGSGGGESKYVLIPSYQQGWNTAGVTNPTGSSTNNLTSRGAPDVSYVADPYTGVSVYFTDPTTKVGGWYVFGGTSAGAPQWAALLARRASLGNAGANSFNAIAYPASKTGYASLFRDVVSGSNGYAAKPSYDLVTGLGSPVAAAIAGLTGVTPAPTPTPTPAPVASPSPTPGVSNVVSVYGINAYGVGLVPAGLAGVSQVAMGEVMAMALKSSGAVVPWGWNVYGQTNIPVNLTNAIQIAVGPTHAVALRSNGTVVAWGMNILGQCNVPAGLTNVTQVAAGGYNTAAVKGDGTVAVWGNNLYKQCNVPAGLTNAVQVAAGYYHVVALKRDGSVVAWGDNSFRMTNIPAGLTNVVQVTAGSYYCAALRSNGTVAVWGLNVDGVANVPAGLTNVVKISAGLYHLAALKSDGTVTCWGYNAYGQCNVPTNVTNAVDVSAGFFNTAVILSSPIPPGSQKIFDYGYKSVGETNSGAYIINQQNVRKYSEWQNPPVSYWGPATNNLPSVMTMRYPFPKTSTGVYLHAELAAFNFNYGGGQGYGSNSLWASKDGVNWTPLTNNPTPSRVDSYVNYDGMIPSSLTGSANLYLQVRSLVVGAPNSSYTDAQFSRSTSSRTNDVFHVTAY